MTAGTGGGGATTLANSIANSGNGQLANYGNQGNATNYIIGVAAGGGGAPDSSCLTRFGRDPSRVHGGSYGSGSSGIFGRGQNGGNFSGYWWTQSTGLEYPDSTEGPSGGGAGWTGGWANNSIGRYNRGQPEYSKTAGEGGSNYVTSKNAFSAGTNNVTIISRSSGIGSNYGGNGSAYIKYLRSQ